MTAKDGFFPRTMSLAVHELRTPVTVVSGYLRMVLREQGGPLTDKQRKMLEEADRSCARIATLVSEMSDLGKLEGLDVVLARQEFDLAALLAELASGMHDGDDRGVTIDVRCADKVMVTGDRNRIAAALKALMYSAVRERGEPGAIVVECMRTSDTSASPNAAGMRQWIVVAIGDESSLAALVDGARGTPPGFDEWRGGLGLALPVARRVIEAHGGAVWSSAEGASRAAAALRLPA